MVLNLCLSHFNTSAHCNKLCADGYDVTNLVSADPALRKRGFKLEYFLRPPVQVTLKFDFQVELCRVDVELWPWGMDRGQACKKLEISTSSDQLTSTTCNQGHKQVQQKELKQEKEQHKQKLERRQELKSSSCQSNGHQWSLQAQQWVEQPQQGGHMSQSHTKTESSYPEPEFKLVGRCEVREETHISFRRSNFSPRPPFLSSAPPQPSNCRQEELWSRGHLSLGAVTQLRVTVPYGGAASALGLKALTVWGQPARCCSDEELERIKRIHETSEKQLRRPSLFTSTVSPTKAPSQAATPLSNLSIPEEFLDPITQEIMMLPMLLPSGVSVDNSTLEEHQKREATWGRAPNDPFTGVPFTSVSQPLPNPQLKSRIDLFLLQKGMMVKDKMLGRQGKGENPQASRLIASKMDEQSLVSPCRYKNSGNSTGVSCTSDKSDGNQTVEETGSGHISENGNYTCSSQRLTTDTYSEFGSKRKLDRSQITEQSPEELTAEKKLLPQTKKTRNDAVSSCSSHEQRLSASLDEALFSALQGRPSFTTNLPGQKPETSDSKSAGSSLQSQTVDTLRMQRGGMTCSACSCSVSVYSKSSSSIYRLTCNHLICGTCLRKKSKPPNSATGSTSNQFTCPSCLNSSQRSDITRVHH